MTERAPGDGDEPDGGTLLVTGLPRSGTSWVGKMLAASGEVVYVNEPMNPRHPPGRSPGVLDANVEHYFHYICADNDGAWLPAFRRTAALKYGIRRELKANRGVYDAARATKYLTSFALGRLRGRRALLDDPYAVLSLPWLSEHIASRAVVLIRDPVTLVGSWHALGWSVDMAELLAQPLLMRDYLGPFRPDMEGLVGTDDWLAATSLLWRLTYSVVRDAAATRPRVLLVRYEDLAGDPLAAFRRLYRATGLSWGHRAERRIRAATTATGRRKRGFSWSVRGGLSRTAFQPMDSRRALTSGRSRLDDEQTRRVLDLVSDIRTHFYGAP